MTAIASRFHNTSDADLADAIGRADAIVKAAEAELKALKDELKARGVAQVQGRDFTVNVSEQIAGRLDAKALRAAFGEAIAKFETAVVSTVIRIKAANRMQAVAA